MRNLKKFLALVLAFVMAASLMVTANAATANVEFSDSESVTEAFAEDITVLNGMGIIKGYEDGTFGPGREVTRAQMAAFVYRIATGDSTDSRADLYRGYSTFSDVDTNSWYAGYIGYCANAQYIVGYTDGTFRPNNPVTGYAALAMILRAMGYNEPGHNFVGTGWEVTVSSTATEIGMLAKISQTSYNATLKQNAPRELVAEMLFQGLIRPTVVWTAAYGYQSNSFITNGESLDTNLGWTYYGLRNHKGIVVGNEVTGEGEHVTKVGFDLVGGTISNRVDSSVSNAYFYSNGYSGYWDKTDDDGNRLPTSSWVGTNRTYSFNWDTDLYDFGHAMDVWYDGRNTNVNMTTYAMFDRVVKTNVVAVDYDVDDGEPGQATLASNSPLRAAIGAGGFGVNVWGTNGRAYLNYAFGPTQDYGTTAANFQSPIMANNSDHEHQLYLVISNTTGDLVDLVVALDLTVTEVTQMNNVQTPKSLGVYNANGTGTSYFDTWDTVNLDYAYTDTYANIAQASLLNSTGKTLGDRVVAMAITGTNPGIGGRVYAYGDSSSNAILADGYSRNVTYSNGDTYAERGAGNTSVSGLKSTYYYQLTKLTHVVPGSVINIDTANQDVYLSNGSVLHKSIFADAVDGTFKDNQYVNAPTFWSTYNFYLDADGNYLFWEPIANSSTFVYGTYLDYVTLLNSSTYTYSIVGVDINGKQVIESPVTEYNTADEMNKWKNFNAGTHYSENPLPKRDSNSYSGAVDEGIYVGYTIDQDGTLTVVTQSVENGGNGGTESQPVIQASDVDFGIRDVTIDKDDARIGAKTVTGTDTSAGIAGLFLTTNTRIYLVSGAGTDTQKIDIYEGIADLLSKTNSSSVTIKSATGNTGANGVTGSLKGDYTNYLQMIYYTKEPFTYAQNYVNSAYQVKEIFIPKEAVEFTSNTNGNLYFVGSASASVVNALGGTATRFTLYDAEGNAGSYWIEGDYRYDDGGDARTVHVNNSNTFYSLYDSGAKAQDGQPIYKIAPVDDAGNTVIGAFWNSDNTQWLANTSDYPAVYKATTYSLQVAFIQEASYNPTDLWNVANAKVINLDTKTYPGIVGLPTLNEAGSLTDNLGVPVSCVLDEDGNVATIFVNAPLITPFGT